MAMRSINDLYFELRKLFREQQMPMPELEAREITAYACNISKKNMADWAHRYVNDQIANRAHDMAQRYVQGEPLAYLIGEWDFMGMTFAVDKRVLIPRADTERLCELAIEAVHSIVNPRVLDLCAGSGCIGIALLAHAKHVRAVGVDIDDGALAVMHENARRNKVQDRYIAMRGNALEAPCDQLGGFHLMVCNPPYITATEMHELEPSVKGFEPHLALFGGVDGLDFYRNIAKEWKKVLLPSGIAFFECGYAQYQQVADILEEQGFENVHVEEDLSGVMRIVIGTMPPAPPQDEEILLQSHRT